MGSIPVTKLDALIVGAGFGGTYQLKRLREEGYKVRIVDFASDYAGVWYWNRYPGARVDSPIPHYEFSDPTLWREWTWTQRFPGSKELRDYFSFVANKWDLRKDTDFNTRVEQADWDESSNNWTVKCSGGKVYQAQFLLLNTGFAAKRYIPDWKGIDKYRGIWIHPSYWPKEEPELRGKKIAVIGTGSTGIQLAQDLSGIAGEFTLFQRTPNMALPMKQINYQKNERALSDERYKTTFAGRHSSFGGFDFSFAPRNTLDDTPEQRKAFYEELWAQGDFHFWLATYQDTLFDPEANKEAYEFWKAKVRARIQNERIKEILAPEKQPYSFGCKRISLENEFYEIFNKPNAFLVDVNATPITEVTERGIRTTEKEWEFDCIACATGFDAITGGLLDMNITGAAGLKLSEKWKGGAKTYLGMSVSGFPNMMFTYGPQAPTALCNGPTCAEAQGEFIIKTMNLMRKEGIQRLDAEEAAEAKWGDEVRKLADMSLLPSTKSWYMGDNIPGKPPASRFVACPVQPTSSDRTINVSILSVTSRPPVHMPTRKVKASERRRCTRACTNCKRRKERCNGVRPCRRCTERNVTQDCRFHQSPQVASTLQTPEPELPDAQDTRGLPQHHEHDELLCFRRVSRVVKDSRGTLSFIGDASNLCFLQDIRRIVVDNFGRCSFVDDPLRRCMVEESSRGLAEESNRSPPSKPTKEQVDYFLTWFERTTDCILPLYDPEELRKDIYKCLQSLDKCPNTQLATFHLVIAIGAQAGPDDHDELAEHHFNFGRYVTLTTLMDEPSITTIQCHTLITAYLLAGSRRNAAFMYLGIAVRGAYALGIHRRDVSLLYDSAEYNARERLWRALRIMDLFMSASLGRPPATIETRDTTSTEEDYSASNDLCWIFENILTSVYSKRVIATECLEKVSQLHRDWTLRFERGLQTDGIRPSGPFYPGADEVPNIGLLHLKEAYYWTINLLSRPFLIQYVSYMLAQRTSDLGPKPNLQGHLIVVQACIDSAFRTADLLYPLVSTALVPKRLPFAVNSAFVAVLVLSTALFADLEDSGVLSGGIQKCRSVLQKFSKYDAVTRRYLMITDYLKEVCEDAIQARRQEKMDSINRSIRQVFGSIHDPEFVNGGSRRTSGVGRGSGVQQEAVFQTQRTPTMTDDTIGAEAETGHDSSTAEINFDLGMHTYSMTGQLNPFPDTPMPGTQEQGSEFSFLTTLNLDPFNEGMLFPIVGTSLLDCGISGDWENDFAP
ncbi:cyclopentanone 1 2-monooxygenase [Fusarium beomiforme]|uniref:Cyclopentanone 1 2-monooxygenase n=1 Tax=Fusarium beomiforme TaxID=44412 RepID=A0A9P5AG39_9HYPO|nr:cyclopentanone 1 2-monooxygenase [Fusarium beomiforme]